jgi:predicted nucleotidyltransferase
MKRTREEVLRIIQENRDSIRRFGVRRLGLFGSCARGESKESSDLDFVVELEKKTFDSFMGLKLFLEDLFGCHVDLGLVDTIKPALREAILSEVVYAEGL